MWKAWNTKQHSVTESSVRTAMGYGLDGRGSIPGRGTRFFSSPQHPDRLRGPPYPMAIGGSFFGGKAVGT
jgi:hypothetical protein